MSMENTAQPPCKKLECITDLFNVQKLSEVSGGRYETPSYGTKVELSHRSKGEENKPKACFNIDTMLHLVKEQNLNTSLNSLTTLSDQELASPIDSHT